MKDLILTIVAPLVDHPEHLEIDVEENDDSVTYKLMLHSDDMGKVIGKQGRVAKSIRTVVYAAAGSHEKKRVFLEIAE
ncbi:KH domain-containing protein [Rossellomorea vietnamensis]|uniref:RNA-binding protein KhpA n=1 Tax=Rossellomorea vietnamensis TaxID=218284 RepID=A0A5D4MDS7_9BACI|nr:MULTISPECIES: KH domain-containing protein [Bacillaceae]TYS00110.1 KH domain-containing protein [Rossellomorea vietnamensis]